jgi:hypothetical protein
MDCASHSTAKDEPMRKKYNTKDKKGKIVIHRWQRFLVYFTPTNYAPKHNAFWQFQSMVQSMPLMKYFVCSAI